MTEQRTGYYRRENNAGITDVMGSFMRMASAGTRFTIDQMFNAMSMLTDPTGAMNRVKHSMDNLSGAMQGHGSHGSTHMGSSSSQGCADSTSSSASMETDEELTGRKT
jgi:hypothetical protein